MSLPVPDPTPPNPAELLRADAKDREEKAAEKIRQAEEMEISAARLRAEAGEEVEKAAAIRALVDGYEAKLGAHTALRPAFPDPLHGTPPLSSDLTSTRVDTTLGLDTMEARTRSDASKFATGAQNAGKGRLATPFGRWLAEQKMAASVWAEAHLDERGETRWSPQAVRGWMLPKNAIGARACPEDAAKLIAKESKGAVAPVDASWPSGISRPRRRPS